MNWLFDGLKDDAVLLPKNSLELYSLKFKRIL